MTTNSSTSKKKVLLFFTYKTIVKDNTKSFGKSTPDSVDNYNKDLVDINFEEVESNAVDKRDQDKLYYSVNNDPPVKTIVNEQKVFTQKDEVIKREVRNRSCSPGEKIKITTNTLEFDIMINQVRQDDTNAINEEPSETQRSALV